MREEQRKPAKRWYKKWTNIVLLLFIVCMIALFCVVMATPGIIDPGPAGTYNITKAEIQAAVKVYQDNNHGELPTVNGTLTINGSDCHIIDICALLVSRGGKLSYVPNSCASVNGSNNDNCDGGNCSCSIGHYIWALDNNGEVYSTCVGENCSAHNKDGYQGAQP